MTASSLWIPYCGAAPLPAELLARWNMDPFLFAFLTTLAALALPRTRGWPSRRRVTLSAAFALIVFLYVSPFCALASALFSARVAHHLLLVLAAAPLLATTIPEERLPGTRSLAAWTAVQAAIFWLWHAPPAYSAALSHDAVFWQMQATLLASAAGFWAALRSAPAPAAAAALLATTVQMGVLGALISRSWRRDSQRRKRL
jgi:putative membrane protein